MTRLRACLHWMRHLVRNLASSGRREAELHADVAAYLELLTDEHIAAGMAPEEARRAALLEFGGIEAVKDETRAVRAGAWLARRWQDAGYAFRLFARERVFTATVVLTVALGIGANSAIFSVVKTVLLDPLPYPDPSRLMLIWERNPAIDRARDPVAPLNYYDWVAQNTTFQELGAFRVRGFALTGAGLPEQLSALATSASVFRALGVEPIVGRVFTSEEERQWTPVAVLAHRFWHRRFGGDPAIVGRAIALDGAAFVVLGVMPPEFAFPDGDPVDLYTPLDVREDERQGRRTHTLGVIGRLRPGATPDDARVDLGAIASRIAAQDATSNPGVTVSGVHDALVEDVRLGLLILLATSAFVILVACANVANLLLVRGTSRRREIALRMALGAPRVRVIGQLLTESVLLAFAGAALGLGLAWWLLRALPQVAPPDLPRLDRLGLDATVLLFTTVAATITGVAFGVIPALRMSKPDTRGTLEDGGRTASGVRDPGRSLLLIAEVALSLVLVAGAGLMIRTLVTAQRLDLGFTPANVLTAQLALPAARYPADGSQFGPLVPDAAPIPESAAARFLASLEQRLLELPGVAVVGAVSALPLNAIGSDYDLPVVIEGEPRPPAGEEPQADFRIATPGYFRAMDIPLLRGRAFTPFDGPNSTSVAIVNETFAREFFGDGDPIGRRVVLYGRPREIVGVVGTVRHRGFRREPRPEMILPHSQFHLPGGMTLVVRSQVDPSTLAVAVASTVQSLDAQQPVFRVRAMQDYLSDSVAQPRFTTALLLGFAGLAFVLAFVGIYGITSHAVGQRAREIAVRQALGARRQDVIRMVVAQQMTLAAAGILAGIGAAMAGTRIMSGLLFGVSATDPLTFGAAAACLGLASLAAAAIPALRAARIAPGSLLKSE